MKSPLLVEDSYLCCSQMTRLPCSGHLSSNNSRRYAILRPTNPLSCRTKKSPLVAAITLDPLQLRLTGECHDDLGNIVQARRASEHTSVETSPYDGRPSSVTEDFSHDDIPIELLELTDDSLRHWVSNGEFKPLPANQEWVHTTMKRTLQSRLRLREALLALKNFSFIRYKPGGKSYWLHPLVHYWASQRLESYPTRQSLIMCSIGLVASSFGKEKRLPPFAVPYGNEDVGSVLEEKSLRLWPWREYKKLAPHAHHCMPYITHLDNLPELMAHLSLSLLQVFEYLSAVDELDEIHRVHRDYAHDIIDHVAKCSEDSDGFFDLSVVLWRLTRAVVCTCHKGETPHERCYRCRNASDGAAQFSGDFGILQAALSTARVRAASLGLVFILYLGGARLQPQILHWKGDEFNSDDPLFKDMGYAGSRQRKFLAIIQKGFVLDKAPFDTWFSDPKKLQSRMEQYVYNFGRYLQIRFSSEVNKGCIDHKLAK